MWTLYKIYHLSWTLVITCDESSGFELGTLDWQTSVLSSTIWIEEGELLNSECIQSEL